MLRAILRCSALVAILAGCSAASATPLDPGNDFHCLGVALGFEGLARAHNAPADQQHATKVVADWYWARNSAHVEARGEEAITAEMAALVPVIDADFPAAQKVMTACTERATRDPAFNRFAARYRR